MSDGGIAPWLVGFGFTVFTVIGGWLIAAINGLHTRVNGVRDQYVRRDDLDGRIAHLERGVESLREEMKQMATLLIERLPAKR